MNDTNAERDNLHAAIHETVIRWEDNGGNIEYMLREKLAGYITTAEADLRVADMRNRAADAAAGIVAANTAKRQWAEALGASESHNAILSLPIIKEGGTQ